MKSLRSFLLLAGFACLGFLMAPSANAGESDEKTMLAFSEPVEIPHAILPAGNYIFKLVKSPVDRHIVQVLSEDGTKVYATIGAIPNFRRDTSERTTVIYEERGPGMPRAIKQWFYPNYSFGHEFVYRNAQPAAMPAVSADAASTDDSSSFTEPRCLEAEPEFGIVPMQQSTQVEESSYLQLLREKNQE